MTNKHLLIAFSGADGSGKTSLARVLQQKLEQIGREPDFIHAHGYKVSKSSLGLSSTAVVKFRRLLTLLVPLAFADNILTYYSNYRRNLRQSDIIVDRYFFDKVCRLVFYGIIPIGIAKIYIRLLPKPDLTFFLVPPASIAFKRKKEYTLEEYERFFLIYNALAEVCHASILDTSYPLEDCADKVFQAFKKKEVDVSAHSIGG